MPDGEPLKRAAKARFRGQVLEFPTLNGGTREFLARPKYEVDFVVLPRASEDVAPLLRVSPERQARRLESRECS